MNICCIYFMERENINGRRQLCGMRRRRVFQRAGKLGEMIPQELNETTVEDGFSEVGVVKG